jgi:hypothetical protein
MAPTLDVSLCGGPVSPLLLLTPPGSPLAPLPAYTLAPPTTHKVECHHLHHCHHHHRHHRHRHLHTFDDERRELD